MKCLTNSAACLHTGLYVSLGGNARKSQVNNQKGGVASQVADWSNWFGPISHLIGPKLICWGREAMGYFSNHHECGGLQEA